MIGVLCQCPNLRTKQLGYCGSIIISWRYYHGTLGMLQSPECSNDLQLAHLEPLAWYISYTYKQQDILVDSIRLQQYMITGSGWRRPKYNLMRPRHISKLC